MSITQFKFFRAVSRSLGQLRSVSTSERLAASFKNAVTGAGRRGNAAMFGGVSLAFGLVLPTGGRRRKNDFDNLDEKEASQLKNEIVETLKWALSCYFNRDEMDRLMNISEKKFDSNFYEQVFADAGLSVDRSREYRLPEITRMQCRMSALFYYMEYIIASKDSKEESPQLEEYKKLAISLLHSYVETVESIESGGFRKFRKLK